MNIFFFLLSKKFGDTGLVLDELWLMEVTHSVFGLGLLHDFGTGTNQYLHPFSCKHHRNKEPSAERDIGTPINRSADPCQARAKTSA